MYLSDQASNRLVRDVENARHDRMPNLRLGDADGEALVRFLEAKGASAHAELQSNVPADAVALVGESSLGRRKN